MGLPERDTQTFYSESVDFWGKNKNFFQTRFHEHHILQIRDDQSSYSLHR